MNDPRGGGSSLYAASTTGAISCPRGWGLTAVCVVLPPGVIMSPQVVLTPPPGATFWLTLPDVKNMGKDLAPEELRIWEIRYIYLVN